MLVNVTIQVYNNRDLIGQSVGQAQTDFDIDHLHSGSMVRELFDRQIITQLFHQQEVVRGWIINPRYNNLMAVVVLEHEQNDYALGVRLSQAIADNSRSELDRRWSYTGAFDNALGSAYDPRSWTRNP